MSGNRSRIAPTSGGVDLHYPTSLFAFLRHYIYFHRYLNFQKVLTAERSFHLQFFVEIVKVRELRSNHIHEVVEKRCLLITCFDVVQLKCKVWGVLLPAGVRSRVANILIYDPNTYYSLLILLERIRSKFVKILI